MELKELQLKLIVKQKKYIRFLGKDYDKMAVFVSIHGWRWSDKDIAKGKRFREDIKNLNKQIKNIIE